MPIARSLAAFLAAAASVLAVACSSGAGDICRTYCKDAQARQCTTIKGDCNTFCSAVDTVAGEGSCTSQEDAYTSCLNQGDTCTGDARCGSQKNAFSNCATAYCVGHLSEASCQTIAASF